MAGAAVLLAGKVEERARKLKDVALSFLTLQQGAAAANPNSEVRMLGGENNGRWSTCSVGRLTVLTLIIPSRTTPQPAGLC